MELTLSQLGQTLEQHGMRPVLRGDGQRLIRGVATLEEAQQGQISFLSNPKYERMLATTGASAVVLKPDETAPSP